MYVHVFYSLNAISPDIAPKSIFLGKKRHENGAFSRTLTHRTKFCHLHTWLSPSKMLGSFFSKKNARIVFFQKKPDIAPKSIFFGKKRSHLIVIIEDARISISSPSLPSLFIHADVNADWNAVSSGHVNSIAHAFSLTLSLSLSSSLSLSLSLSLCLCLSCSLPPSLPPSLPSPCSTFFNAGVTADRNVGSSSHVNSPSLSLPPTLPPSLPPSLPQCRCHCRREHRQQQVRCQLVPFQRARRKCCRHRYL